MHTYHGDIHEIGLQDDCEECTYHAEEPWRNLDNRMLAELCRRNWYYRFGTTEERQDNEPRSLTEMVAMTSIQNLWERIGRIMECDETAATITYLNKRWHIPVGEI